MTRPNDKIEYVENWQYSGLTKREYFAAMAFQALFANSRLVSTPDDDLIQVSIEIADKLITALNESE